MSPMTMTPADEALYREQMSDGRAYRIERPSLVVNARAAWAECDATRAKLAEAEAIVVQSHCDLTTLNRSLTAAESRVAALTEAGDALVKSMVAWGSLEDGVPDFEIARKGAADNPFACIAAWRALVPAALSPSQDAKDGGAV